MEYGKLNVLPEVWARRKKRMLWVLTEMENPPDYMVADYARMLAQGFDRTLTYRWHNWKMCHMPHWYHMLTSKTYREGARMAAVDEKDVR